MRRIRVLAVLAAAATVAACSGSAEPAGEPGSESTPTSAVPSVGHGSLAYCLREHGVSAGHGPMPGPPRGVDVQVWHEAMSECSSLAPGPAG
ncbi:MAG: hypothetical protein VYB90_01440 [Actinomycetota bacterium]|nr:hypothetical protein [Actinomycetota bacterium]